MHALELGSADPGDLDHGQRGRDRSKGGTPVRRKVLAGFVVLAAAMLVLTDPASAHFGGGGAFSCRASALRVQSPIINTEPVVANPPRVPCQTDFKQFAPVAVPPLVVAGVLTAQTMLNPLGVPGGKADSSVLVATVTVGGATVTAQVLTASAQAGCAIENGMPLFAGSSQVVGLTINNGMPISVSNPVTIPANPLVTVYLNRQFITNNSVITQCALEVVSPALGVDIVVAEAIADVESCNPVVT